LRFEAELVKPNIPLSISKEYFHLSFCVNESSMFTVQLDSAQSSNFGTHSQTEYSKLFQLRMD